jgi:hypothetical protein
MNVVTVSVPPPVGPACSHFAYLDLEPANRAFLDEFRV